VDDAVCVECSSRCDDDGCTLLPGGNEICFPAAESQEADGGPPARQDLRDCDDSKIQLHEWVVYGEGKEAKVGFVVEAEDEKYRRWLVVDFGDEGEPVRLDVSTAADCVSFGLRHHLAESECVRRRSV
jgi:hypothetical protein